MKSSQPLTDTQLAEISARYEGDARALFGLPDYGATTTVRDARLLLAELDRLRAELDSMTRFAADLREERDRRLRSEGERGVERDALAAKIEATAELHPAWFCETCNSPGPCLTRIRLGLDQGGRGQDA